MNSRLILITSLHFTVLTRFSPTHHNFIYLCSTLHYISLDKLISRAFGTDTALVRFPSRLFGWYSYEFLGEVEAGRYDLRAVHNNKRCRVLLSCEVGESGLAKCHIQISSKGIKGRHVKVISKELSSRIQSSVVQTAHTIKNRRRVISAESKWKKKQRKAHLKKEKQKALDKVLNPEKYRTPSPSVRKEGGGGFNPYIPELGRGTHRSRGVGSMSAVRAAEARKPRRG